MATTYEKIATTTLGSAASSITFSSIAATYTDLRVTFVGASTGGANLRLQLNTDTGTNYSKTNLYGRGATADSARSTSAGPIYLTDDGITSTPHFYAIDLFSYAGSTYKTFLWEGSEDNNGSGSVVRGVGLWRNTAAITSVILYDNGNTFNTGTTATLYGILKA